MGLETLQDPTSKPRAYKKHIVVGGVVAVMVISLVSGLCFYVTSYKAGHVSSNNVVTNHHKSSKTVHAFTLRGMALHTPVVKKVVVSVVFVVFVLLIGLVFAVLLSRNPDDTVVVPKIDAVTVPPEKSNTSIISVAVVIVPLILILVLVLAICKIALPAKEGDRLTDKLPRGPAPPPGDRASLGNDGRGQPPGGSAVVVSPNEQDPPLSGAPEAGATVDLAKPSTVPDEGVGLDPAPQNQFLSNSSNAYEGIPDPDLATLLETQSKLYCTLISEHRIKPSVLTHYIEYIGYNSFNGSVDISKDDVTVFSACAQLNQKVDLDKYTYILVPRNLFTGEVEGDRDIKYICMTVDQFKQTPLIPLKKKLSWLWDLTSPGSKLTIAEDLIKPLKLVQVMGKLNEFFKF